MNPEVTDATQSPEILDALRALGAVFVGRIPGYLTAMDEEINKIESDNNDVEPLNTLHRQLHTIAGSAGSFGYTELGDRARQCEHRINAALKSLTPENPIIDHQFFVEFIPELRQFMQWISVQFNVH